MKPSKIYLVPLVLLLFSVFFAGQSAPGQMTFVTPYHCVADSMDLLRLENVRAKVDDSRIQQEFAESHYKLIRIYKKIKKKNEKI